MLSIHKTMHKILLPTDLYTFYIEITIRRITKKAINMAKTPFTIEHYLESGALTSQQLQVATRLSQPAISRQIQQLGSRVVKLTNGRQPDGADWPIVKEELVKVNLVSIRRPDKQHGYALRKPQRWNKR